ncbi:MAG: PLP-dependent aminotransferase family protein [Deinococcus sp.]
MPASRLPPLLPALAGEPRHQRAARSLREAIVRGELAAGERLSTRRLAQGWGLGRNTVQDGLEQLQSEGYLEVRAQSGSYVAPGVSQRGGTVAMAGDDLPQVPLSGWAVRALSGERPDAPANFRVDFRLGQPAGLFPSQLWAEALARRAADPAGLLEGGELGPLPTRQAIALWLSRERGAAVTPEMVMLTGGTQPALDLLARTYLEAGRTAVIEDPGYPGAGRAFAATGATLWPLPTDEQGMRVSGLPLAASLAYLTPGCQFPGTATLSASRRAALLEWARTPRPSSSRTTTPPTSTTRRVPRLRCKRWPRAG